MVKNNEKPVVVRPPLKTVEHWITVLGVPTLFAGAATWCCWVTAVIQNNWGWLILLAGMWLVGVLMMVVMSFDTVGAVADSTGLTIERAFQASFRKHIDWQDLRAMEITITPERRGAVRYIVELEIGKGSVTQVVECPYDVTLCREIASRAHLTLHEAPDGWRAVAPDSQDPFDAIKRLRGKEQQWVWTRSDG